MADDAVPEFEDRRKQSLWERLDAIEVECRRGHRDLRKCVNELEAQADALGVSLTHLAARVEDVKNAPVESTKIRFSTGVMVSIVIVTISVVGSAYGLSSSVNGEISRLGTAMNRQAEDDKKDRESLAKLYDERNLRTLGAIDTLTRQQKLLEYEMQRLREDVTKRSTK